MAAKKTKKKRKLKVIKNNVVDFPHIKVSELVKYVKDFHKEEIKNHPNRRPKAFFGIMYWTDGAWSLFTGLNAGTTRAERLWALEKGYKRWKERIMEGEMGEGDE